MKKTVATLFVALTVANCAPPEDYAGAIAASKPASASIKQQIVQDARDFLADPYSVRDAEISNVATFSNGSQGVCVRANAKNKLGGYTGRQTMAITIRNGVLAGHTMNHPLCARPDILWMPFPELEALAQL